MNCLAPRLARRLHQLLLSTIALGLAVAAPVWAEPGQDVDPTALEAEKRAARLLDHLRSQDQVLERWARQLTHPQGVGPDQDTLRHFTEGLIHIGADVNTLAESYPDLERKHRSLVRRAREVASAFTLEKSARADLAPLAESVRWLDVPDAARLKVGSTDQLSKPTCEAAANLGLDEKRAVPTLDGATEILVRFVPEKDGYYRLDTAGSRTDTRLALLDGCSGKVLRSADDEDSLRARLEFEGMKDVPVWIRVGSDREGAVLVEAELLAEKGVGTASISGTVTARATGLPLADAFVRLHSGGSYVWDYTNADGRYTFNGVPAGIYRLDAEFSGLVHQAWQGIDCEYYGCGDSDGDLLEVDEGQALSDINFSLGRRAILSGRILAKEAGEAIDRASVRLESEGSSAYSVQSDEAGRFRFYSVAPGTYYLKVEAARFRTQLFDGFDCYPSCEIESGTPIQVEAEQVLSGLDVVMDRLGGIAGLATTTDGGQPVLSGRVTFYDSTSLTEVASSNISQGEFYSPLDPGSYLARFWASQFESQMFDGIDCPEDCDLSLATSVEVGEDQIVSIEFRVQNRSTIAGSVGSTDGQPLGEFGYGYVELNADDGSWVDSQHIFQFGSYGFSGLLGGDYFVLAIAEGFRSEWYDDIPCTPINDCQNELGGISVPRSTDVSGVDFLLDRFGSITGRVTRLDGVTPLSGIPVYAESVDSNDYYSSSTDSDGYYEIEQVKPGKYGVRTSDRATIDELYDDMPCEGGCDETSGTPVVVALGSTASSIDFQLQLRGWISGTVRNAATGKPLHYASVRVFDSGGSSAASGEADSNGEYRIEGLADGTYFVQVYGYPGYVGEIHDGILCAYYESCDPTDGTLVSVTTGAETVVDLEMVPGGSITGTVRNTVGDLVYSYTNLYDASGNWIE